MSNLICAECLGARHSLFFNAYDFFMTADWLTSVVSHAQYLQVHQGWHRSPYASVPGWTSGRNRDDLCHTLYLGQCKDGTAEFICDFAVEMGGD